MPLVIDNPYTRSGARLQKISREEVAANKLRYPRGLDFTPGSKLHEYIKGQILERAREAERYMTTKHSTWKRIDESLNVFVQLDQEELDAISLDTRSPVSIVVPESYATLDTLLTYMLAAFGTPPFFSYLGTGPEQTDTLGAILLELVIENQLQKSKGLLAAHTAWRDGFTYGFGAVTPIWEVQKGRQQVVNDLGYYNPFDGSFVKTGEERTSEEAIIFEGNRLKAIDPYRYLPDPNARIYEPQTAEYIGWMDSHPFTTLRRMEAGQGSIFFNVGYLRDFPARSSIYQGLQTGRDKENSTTEANFYNTITQMVDTIYLYWDLIPNDHGLGPSTQPEKWVFALSNDAVITSAYPLDLNHMQFPIAVCAPNYGGHEMMPISHMEVMSGMQSLINFYYNTHMENVLKALQNVFVVDPKVIHMPDLLVRAPRIIRTRQPIWGKGIKEAIQQLQVNDVTGNHINDLMITRDLARNTLGTVDSLQGLQRTSGERVTKAEFMGTRSSALSRLQKMARIISNQMMTDLGTLCAYHTQQFMSMDTYVQVAGRWEEVLRMEYGVFDRSIKVTPFDVNIAFDVQVHDGSIEGGEYVDQWIQLYDMILRNPEAVQQMDTVRIFQHIARLMKTRNIQDFRRTGFMLPNATVLPDQQVGNMAASGQVVPLGSAA